MRRLVSNVLARRLKRLGQSGWTWLGSHAQSCQVDAGLACATFDSLGDTHSVCGDRGAARYLASLRVGLLRGNVAKFVSGRLGDLGLLRLC